MAKGKMNPGGIWKNDDAKHLSMSIDMEALKEWVAENPDEGKVRFVIFPNDYKEHGDNKPDFNVLFATKREEKSPPKQVKSTGSMFG